jgi:hypothetical protein
MEQGHFMAHLASLSAKYNWNQFQVRAAILHDSGESDNTANKGDDGTVETSRTVLTIVEEFTDQGIPHCPSAHSSASKIGTGKRTSGTGKARRTLSESEESDTVCAPMNNTREKYHSPASEWVDAEVVTASKRSVHKRVVLSDSDSEVEPLLHTRTQKNSRVVFNDSNLHNVMEGHSAGQNDICGDSDMDWIGLDGSGSLYNSSDAEVEPEAGTSRLDALLGEYEYDDWLVEDTDEGGDDYDGSRGGDSAEDKSDRDGENDYRRMNAQQPTQNELGSTRKPTAKPEHRKAAFTPATPKLSKIDRNFQRVLALSTGKKRTQSYHHSLAQDLYRIYNEVIFDNQLPADLSVTWNKRLLTTAGYCRVSKKRNPLTFEVDRYASIELSTKVSAQPDPSWFCFAVCVTYLPCGCRCATRKSGCARLWCTRCATPPRISSTATTRRATASCSRPGAGGPRGASRTSV